MKEALKFVGGSVAVYVVMAACSSKSPTPDVGSYAPSTSSSGGASMMAGGGMGNGGLAQVGGDTSSMAGQLGASGQADGAGGANADSSGGNGPHDAGVMDAMADAMSDAMTDPTPDAAAQEMSGSRLKARYYVGDDGSKQFVGWYDSQRKENCSVTTAGDGSLRCLPTFTASGASYYADANCSTPLFVASVSTTGCPNVSGMYGYTLSACSTFTPYTLTAANPSMIYTGKPGACMGTTPPTALAFYTGSEIQVTAFVKMTDTVE